MLNKKDLINYIIDLKKLVAIDSPSNDVNGIKQVIDFCKKHVESLDLKCIELKSENLDCPCLLITNVDDVYEDKIDVLMLAHMDTVYPVGTSKDRGFKIEGDKAFGAGVIDDKGGLLLGLYALHNINLSKTKIAFFINSNEELGSEHNCEFIKKIAPQAKVCLCLEAAREDGSLVGARYGVAEYVVDINKINKVSPLVPQTSNSSLVAMSHLISALSVYNEVNQQMFVNFKLIDNNDDASVNSIGDSSGDLNTSANSINHKDINTFKESDSLKKINNIKDIDAVEITNLSDKLNSFTNNNIDNEKQANSFLNSKFNDRMPKQSLNISNKNHNNNRINNSFPEVRNLHNITKVGSDLTQNNSVHLRNRESKLLPKDTVISRVDLIQDIKNRVNIIGGNSGKERFNRPLNNSLRSQNVIREQNNKNRRFNYTDFHESLKNNNRKVNNHDYKLKSIRELRGDNESISNNKLPVNNIENRHLKQRNVIEKGNRERSINRNKEYSSNSKMIRSIDRIRESRRLSSKKDSNPNNYSANRLIGRMNSINENINDYISKSIDDTVDNSFEKIVSATNKVCYVDNFNEVNEININNIDYDFDNSINEATIIGNNGNNKVRVINQTSDNDNIIIASYSDNSNKDKDIINITNSSKVENIIKKTKYFKDEAISLKILVRFMNAEILELADNIINQVKVLNSNVIKVDVEKKNVYPAMEDNITSKKIKFLVEYLGKANYIDIKWQDSFGGSDACFASSVNCPTIDGLGPIGGNFHSEDEYIDLSSVIPRGNLLIDIIKYFAINE